MWRIMPDPFEVIQAQDKLPAVRRRKDGFNRSDVVGAFQQAFEVIGGVNRLTLWANQNPKEFYQLYSKLMPATSYNFNEGTLRTIHHALPPTALDMHPGSEERIIVPEEPLEVPRES